MRNKHLLSVEIGAIDRTDTLNTYFRLQEIQDRHPEKSYLFPSLLFALVYIDLNTAKIDDEEYGFAEQIVDRFYARQDNDDLCLQYHLPCFFRYLYDFYKVFLENNFQQGKGR